jgi:hypothetical protein
MKTFLLLLIVAALLFSVLAAQPQPPHPLVHGHLHSDLLKELPQ